MECARGGGSRGRSSYPKVTRYLPGNFQPAKTLGTLAGSGYQRAVAAVTTRRRGTSPRPADPVTDPVPAAAETRPALDPAGAE